MSLRKAIFFGKEHRKPYRGSKNFDRTCRNGGTCPFCTGTRTYKNRLRKKIADEKIREYYRD